MSLIQNAEENISTEKMRQRNDGEK